MMHPLAGHAAIAAETPPGKRSANRIFERFCMLTTPLLSVIWEFMRDVEKENFGIVLIVPAKGMRVEAVNGPAILPAFGALAAADAGLAVAGSAPGRFRAAELVPALANADAGNPPNVLASPAFNA